MEQYKDVAGNIIGELAEAEKISNDESTQFYSVTKECGAAFTIVCCRSI